MNVTRLMTAAAFAALIASPALAQTTTQTDTTQTGVLTTGATTPTQNTSNANAAASGSWSSETSAGASTSGSGMMTSMTGNVQVTANAPIPDTPENRARYGQPESRAGRAKLGEGPVQALPRSGS